MGEEPMSHTDPENWNFAPPMLNHVQSFRQYLLIARSIGQHDVVLSFRVLVSRYYRHAVFRWLTPTVRRRAPTASLTL